MVRSAMELFLKVDKEAELLGIMIKHFLINAKNYQIRK